MKKKLSSFYLLNLCTFNFNDKLLQSLNVCVLFAHMQMNVHIGKICSKALDRLYIRQIRKFLTVQSTKTPVHAFISSHLDYCNALLFGLPKYQLDRLQKVQNAVARVIFQIPKFDHITLALIDLHWLPVTFRAQFKWLLFVYKSLHNQSPPCIKDLLSLKPATNYALRSSAQSLLFVPKANCSSLGDKVFAHAAPVFWNSLPLTIRTSSSLAIFKKQLKTFLFRKAFSSFQ